MLTKKKLLLLGGLRYLLPAIKAAHELDIHVITCDYLPDNVAHKYSDEYHNVNITDKEAVLELAKKLQIDGIMSFAVDPGVVTAAYVAEKLNLPFQGSYESVCILQNKDKFRSFLKQNGFNTPKAQGFNSFEDCLKEIDTFKFPIIVKPVDSAGSKGVSRVDDMSQLENAVTHAIEESKKGRFIIEEFIETLGYSSDSDCFTINGELVVCTFSDQIFDIEASNPYTPAAYIWPSSMSLAHQTELKKELQRLMTLLDMKTGIYNIETRVGKDGKPYIMEVSPRAGGNRLAEMIKIKYGQDLIKAAVGASIGIVPEINEPENDETEVIELILHSNKEGQFKKLIIADNIKCFVEETDLWVKEKEMIEEFNGANKAIGTLVLKTSENNLRPVIIDNKSIYEFITL